MSFQRLWRSISVPWEPTAGSFAASSDLVGPDGPDPERGNPVQPHAVFQKQTKLGPFIPGQVPDPETCIIRFGPSFAAASLACLCVLLLLLGTFGFPSTVQAQNPSLEATSLEVNQTGLLVSEVAETYLENGLKVLLKADQSSPVISLGIWIRVGSYDAGLETTGISHFVEHLTLSSRKPTAATGRPWMERYAGGFLQGFTFLDQTAYFASVVKNDFDDLLKIVAQGMQKDRFETDQIELERGLLVAEALRREDDSRLVLDEEVTATALKRHPYRWPVGGWLPDMERTNGNQLWDHYRRYYTPNNTILVLVGDFHVDKAIRAVRQHFHAIPRRVALPRVPLSEPEQRGERRLRLTGPGQVPYLQVAFRAPGIHQSDLYGLWLLDAVLCRAKRLSVGFEPLQERVTRTSRLYRALVNSEVATHVHSSLHVTRYPYLYKLLVTLPGSSHFELAQEMLDHELERLKDGEISDDDLNRARRQLKTRFRLDQSSIGRLAYQLGTFESIASIQLLEGIEEKIDAISRVDLQRVARRIFSKKTRTVGWFLPQREDRIIGVEKLSASTSDTVPGGQEFKKFTESLQASPPVFGPPGHGSRFSATQVASRMAGGSTVAGRVNMSSESTGLLQSSLLQQPLSPPWTAKRHVLGNGMIVWIASHPARETFSLRLTFRAGAVRDSDETAGLAYLSGQLLPDGSDEVRSAWEAIESLGVSTDIETNYLETVIHLQGRGQNLSEVLASVARMVRNLNFSDMDFRRQKGVVLNELNLEVDSAAHTAEQAFRRRIHPWGHPFGRNIKGSQETVELLRPSDVVGFSQRFHQPNQLILSLVSDQKGEEVLSSVKEYFADWQSAEVLQPLSIEAVPPGLGVGQQLIRLRGRSYGTLIYGLPGVSRRHPDYFPMLVLLYVLGQQTRLGSPIVSPEGSVSYLLGATGASLEGGVFMIRLGVKPGGIKNVTSFIREQLADLQNREVTPEEVLAAKKFLLNAMLVSLSSNSGLTAAMTQAEWLDPGENALQDWLGRIHGVTVEQVIDVSRTRLLLDRAATVIAGPDTVLK